ncbi:MAG: hypothetical protein ACE5WD_13315 [Candidatus Aminicenantia bacterium]
MKEILIELIHKLGIIEYAKNGEEIELVHGGKSSYKIFADRLFTNPEATELIEYFAIKKLLEIEKNNKCKYEIAGVYTGGFIFIKRI